MDNSFTTVGIMGWPVSHSRSPLIHNFWIKKYGLIGAYGSFAVHPTNLEGAINGIRALNLGGCNITIPHKVNAIQHVDWIDPLARRVGAINTIVRAEDGKLQGYNNDCFGFIQSVLEADSCWRADAGPILVLGAGGACRAIIVSLLDAGATEIRVANRTQNKSDELAEEFGSVISPIAWADRNDALSDVALLINTTSQGMCGQGELELDLDKLPTTALVSDIIYTPLETSLLAGAKSRGNTTINGLGMLLHQARPAFKAWFGIDPEITSELRNLVISSLFNNHTEPE